MILVVVAAAAVVSLAVWIFAPLFSTGRGPESLAPAGDDAIDDLMQEKESAYRAILDLEFDHTLGKVNDTDYAVLRSQHETEAIAALRKLDATASSEGSEADLIEREIAEARARLRAQRR
jgi:hypothetical protein